MSGNDGAPPHEVPAAHHRQNPELLHVEYRPLASLVPYARNARTHSDAQVAQLAASIREYQWTNPVLVDGEGGIIAGHARVLAARQLGLEVVPVIELRHLSEAQRKAYILADNQLALNAGWDADLLRIELTELKELGTDLGLIGFSEEELSRFMADVADGATDPDSIPAPPDEPVTQKGDLWILGNHRLLCGDSASPCDVDRLLDGQVIHLVNTDPPYNVKVEPRSNNAIVAGLSSFALPGKADQHDQQSADLNRYPEKSRATHKKLRPKDRPLMNDFMSDEDFERMLDGWFGNIARVLVPGGAFYIWGGYANCSNYPPVLRKHGLYFSQSIIWDKEHPVLTRKDFMGAHEWCQPAGTQVLTAEGYSSIEAMRDRDRVIGYDASRGYFIQAKHGVPIAATSRAYDGPLLGVNVAGKTTWCTEGHHWTVRFRDNLRGWWCVYLMRRGDWWRVGKSKMQTTWGLGPKQRLLKEKADEAWILSVHSSNVDAMVQEQAISVRYGIPTTYWEGAYGPHRPEQRQPAQIADLYGRLDMGQLHRGAMAALAAFHRNPSHPILRAGETRDKFGRRVGMEVHACNLIPHLMLVPVKRPRLQSEWCPINHIDLQHHTGTVFSLGVPIGEHYVADGIVTHNCFYGWREGAGHKFYGPNNIPDLWAVKKVNPQSMIHLTEKPVELAVRAITYSSLQGENILDLFGGSGSTLIACEQTGRKAFLMEIDPLYCDVVVQRWEAFTQRKAQRVAASPPHQSEDEKSIVQGA